MVVSGSSPNYQYRLSEYSETWQPVLFIDYAPAVAAPEPATLGLPAFGDMGMVGGAVRRRRRT
ncbi:MAG: hypothetical protein BIFFINMI_04059 [Phycisphaerae bacterium]|nr:hypothetical protein [Phycisphaerae bacterium]